MFARISASAALAAAFAAPLAARASDADALVRDTQNFTRMHSFRVSIAYDTGRGTLHSQMIFVAPDRMRVDASAAGGVYTRVTIGRTSWVRYGAGKWQKVEMPANSDPLANIRDQTALAKNIHSYVVKFLGTQTLDGKAMHVYQYAVPPKKGFSARVSRIWIGTGDGFPHKIEQSNGPLRAVLTYSDFNAPLSVSGP